MNVNKGYVVAGLVIAFILFFEIAAHAAVWDVTRFYPGNSNRNEFLHSKQKEKELAQHKVQAVIVHEQTRASSETSAVGNLG